jgi:GH18 family chitinase
MSDFEIGIYLHTVHGPVTADRVTIFQEALLSPAIERKTVSLALDKKSLARDLQWRGQDVTVMACHEISLEHECQRLLREGFQVRVAIPARLELLQDFKVARVASLDVDFDLMAFDLIRPISGERTEFHSPLFAKEGPSVLQTLEHLHHLGIARDRITLGLSSFGVVFKEVAPGLLMSGYGQPCHGVQGDPEISWDELQMYQNRHPKARLFYTAFSGAFQSFIYNSDNGDWISFDDAKTQQSKMAWARRQGLRGVFLWH